MPPTLLGIPFVYDHSVRLLFAGATSEAQTEAFTFHFHHTTGLKLIPITTGTAGRQAAGRQHPGLGPVQFLARGRGR